MAAAVYRMMFRGTIAVVLLCVSTALAQQLTFEVASIKPAAPQSMRRLQGSADGGPGTSDPGRMRLTDVTLRMLIQRAYGVQSFQVAGPSWMDSRRFDIVAKVPAGATREGARVMLQNLLAERFRLKLHKESKEAAVYDLVVAKGGIKFKSASDDTAAQPPLRDKAGALRMPRGQSGIQSTADGRMRLRGDAVTMTALAETLGMALGRPVLDKTELTGTYDIQADFSPAGIGLGPKGAPEPGEGNPDSGPTIFTALQEQLGLKLESRKGPIDVLVVDRAERTPAAN